MSKIVITGGSSGLGFEIKRALEANPYPHIFHEVHNFSLPEYDVRNIEDCEAFMERVCKDQGIDILINCAGVSRLEWLENTTKQDWDYMFQTNCEGLFNMTRAALPYLSNRKGYGRRHKEGGTILNICSKTAFVPMTCTHIYNASKAAIHMQTLQMARELKPRHDITVFGIGPNDMEATGMSNMVEDVIPALRGWTKEYADEYAAKARPAGAPTPPRLIAEFIAYLLQDKQHHRFLTGAIIPYGV